MSHLFLLLKINTIPALIFLNILSDQKDNNLRSTNFYIFYSPKFKSCYGFTIEKAILICTRFLFCFNIYSSSVNFRDYSRLLYINANNYYCYYNHMLVYVYKQALYISIHFLCTIIKCFECILICEK